MKIYVITAGSYDFYHICAVTDTKERAEYLQKVIGSKYVPGARIEEYHTEYFDAIPDLNYQPFYCKQNKNKSIHVEFSDIDGYKASNFGTIKIDKFGLPYTILLAKDKFHAKNIFMERLKETTVTE